MRTIQVKIYEFDELSDAAKKRAREWYRSTMDSDEYAHFVIADAEEIAEQLGFELDTRPVPLMDGTVRYDPAIWWSGFYSQGDGACFEGRWRAADVKPGKVNEHAPQDRELHRIAAEFEAIAAKHAHARFTVTHRGHHYHEYCTAFDFDECPTAECVRLTDAARSFMRWIYSRLKSEYEYRSADAQIDESIAANEYEFLENGVRS